MDPSRSQSGRAPVVLIHETTSQKQLILDAKYVYDEYNRSQRSTITKAHDLGRLLHQIKEKSERGEFTAIIRQLGMPRTTAYKFLKIFRYNKQIDLFSCATIDEAERRIAELPDDIADDDAAQGDQAEPHHPELLNQPETSPAPDPIQPRASRPLTPRPPKPDTYDLKAFKANYGRLVRDMEAGALLLGIKDSPEFEGCRRLSDSFVKSWTKVVQTHNKTQKGE